MNKRKTKQAFSSANPFIPNASFLYPWKHQKTLRFSDISKG